MPTIITVNSKETKKLGSKIAQKIFCGGVICLIGDLGSGKTTFTQGLLKKLKVKGPYNSPTFVIIKHYRKKIKNLNIYHIDAYRIKEKDLLNLGWKEMISNPKNIIIIEWADRIKKIITSKALWIKFEWLDEKKRKIIF